MRLGQAMVFVSDLPRMQRFYRDLLGLAVIEETSGFARYDAGGAWLALHAIPPEYAVAISDPPVKREDTPIKLTFHVDDVAATRERLLTAGVEMGELWSWNGHRACDGTDPEGNVFQIATPATPAT